MKAQFAQLDKELSRMRADSLSDIASSPPDELIRHMLYFIGKSCSGRDLSADLNAERSNKIRELLSLDKWFSYDPHSAFEDECGELVNALKGLSLEITREDIIHLENRIDRYFSGEYDAEEKAEFFEELDTLSQALDDDRFGVLKDFVIEFCDAARKTNLDPDSLIASSADIKVASALLMFDDVLRNPDLADRQWADSLVEKTEELHRLTEKYEGDDGFESSGNNPRARAEFEDARNAVVLEIKRNLNEVENFFSSDSISFGGEPSKIGGENARNSLPSISRNLFEVAHLFGFLEQNDVRNLTEASASMLKHVVEDEDRFSGRAKEKFAFVFASIGVCADVIREDNSRFEKIISRAQKILDSINEDDSKEPDKSDFVSAQEKTGPPGVEDSQADTGELFEEADQQIEEALDLTDQVEVDSGSDEEELILPTDELIEDLESIIHEIGTQDNEGVALLLDQIDEVRKNIDFRSEDTGDFLHLSLLFNSIEDKGASLSRPETAAIAAIGSQLVTRIIYQEIICDAEVEDCIGRISRQLRQIEINGESVSDADVNAWNDKLASLKQGSIRSEDVGESGETFSESHQSLMDDLNTGESGDLNISQSDALSDKNSDDTKAVKSTVASSVVADGQDPGYDSATGVAGNGLLLDDDLKTVFVGELRSHATSLGAISGKLLGLDIKPDERKDIREYCVVVARVVHTLIGNFNNVGLISVGDSLESVESFIVLQTVSGGVVEHYAHTLGELSYALLTSANDLEEPGSLSDSTLDLLVAGGNGFREINRLLVKESLPLPMDFDSKSDIVPINESAAELDFAIGAAEEDAKDTNYDDDFDQDLKLIFLEESESLLNRVNGLLTQWRSSGFSDYILSGIRREFHTLKGSASIAGYDDVSRLSHVVESLLERENPSLADDDSTLLNLMEEMHDGLASELGFIPGGDDNHIRSLISMVELLLAGDNDSAIAGLLESGEELIAEDTADNDSNNLVKISHLKNSSLGDLPDEDEVFSNAAEADSAMDDEGLNAHSLLSFQQVSNLEPTQIAENEITDSDKQITEPEIDDSDQMPEGLVGLDDVDTKVFNPEEPDDSSDEVAPEKVSSFRDNGQLTGPPVSAPQEAGLAEVVSAESPVGTMRIENRKLTDLLNFSGELGLTRTQLKATLDRTRDELDVLRESMKKIRDGLRDLEFEADAQMRAMPESQTAGITEDDFDPLQLDRYSRLQAKAREVNQQLDDLTRVERQLSERASELGGTLVQQFHLGEQLQDGLISARMVAVNEYLPRLRQLVRETSRRVGKSVNFSSEGGDIEVDRQVMDAMMAPFEHMVRNSVSHGIEDLPDRKSAGKDDAGQVHMSVSQQGSELLIDFKDDGKGLDRERLGNRAVELGLAKDIASVSDELLLQVITEPGFTTAEAVSMEAGRGVGMDVVLQAVRLLGGSMSISASSGEGTTFSFRLPVTMTISQALLVHVGAFRFAVLTRSIDRVMRVKSEEILSVDDTDHVAVGDQDLPVINLAERLGQPSLSTAEKYRSLILVKVGHRIAAFEVDQFDETVEIVTKTPGTQLTSINGITGVTVLADTSIVLILNPGEFLDRGSGLVYPGNGPAFESGATNERVIPDVKITDLLQRVLVVDDSLVVRKVMQRDLEGFGLDVKLAVDGINALEVLEDDEIEIALVDLEMPRMNGYELLVRLRQDERFVNLPVVVITSRASNLHRERAMSLGANAYITKPYDIKALEQTMKSVLVDKPTIH